MRLFCLIISLLFLRIKKFINNIYKIYEVLLECDIIYILTRKIYKIHVSMYTNLQKY